MTGKAMASRKSVEEVYEAAKLALEDPRYKDGIGPADLKRELGLPHDVSHVSACMRTLFDEGYLLLLPGSMLRKKFYGLTAKEFKPVAKPPAYAASTPPLMEDRLTTDINCLIENLESIQEVLPRVLAGLLDMSKYCDKFKKLKEILADVSSVARRNL